MQIKPISFRIEKQLKQHGLKNKFKKQLALFVANSFHPSLHTEKLEPKSVGLYSFRINKKYRAIFRIKNGETEIIHLTKHYQK